MVAGLPARGALAADDPFCAGRVAEIFHAAAKRTPLATMLTLEATRHA